MISVAEYNNFFKQIARQHTQILHTDEQPRYFRIRDPRDLATQLNKADGFILMVETPENKYSDNQADNFMKERTAAFAVFKQVKKIDDFIAIDDAHDQCETITEDIMKLMRKKNKDFNDQLFGYLPISSFSSFRVGPHFNSWYGVRMEFQFGDSISMCVDNSKWDFNL